MTTLNKRQDQARNSATRAFRRSDGDGRKTLRFSAVAWGWRGFRNWRKRLRKPGSTLGMWMVSAEIAKRRGGEGRPHRDALMGAAVVVERAEVPAVGPAEPVVRVEGLNYYYGEGEARNQVLFDNRIEIPAGDLVVMTGPSGAEKTTLLTLIGALRTVQEGRIQVVGRDISRVGAGELVEVRREIGFILQMHNLFEALSAYENVKMAAQLSDAPAAEIRRRSIGILERLGLGYRMDYKPRHLSGGERQRVAISRALVNRPRLILADEPTAALDRDSTMNLVELLKETTVMDGTAVLMLTHDQRIIDAAGRLVHMVDGRIMSDGMRRDTTIWPPMGRRMANRERYCHQSCLASKGREERDRSRSCGRKPRGSVPGWSDSPPSAMPKSREPET
jgi:ABC exporter DevA family ATP-binding subunit